MMYFLAPTKPVARDAPNYCLQRLACQLLSIASYHHLRTSRLEAATHTKHSIISPSRRDGRADDARFSPISLISLADDAAPRARRDCAFFTPFLGCHHVDVMPSSIHTKTCATTTRAARGLNDDSWAASSSRHWRNMASSRRRAVNAISGSILGLLARAKASCFGREYFAAKILSVLVINDDICNNTHT